MMSRGHLLLSLILTLPVAAEPTSLEQQFVSAVGSGNVAVVRKMLKRRNVHVDYASPETRGFTALHHAVQTGHTELIELLLNFAASLDQLTDLGLTALQLAANRGQADAARTLIGAGAALDVTEPNLGASALMMAAFGGHTDVVALLLDAGANVTLTGNCGSEADEACRKLLLLRPQPQFAPETYERCMEEMWATYCGKSAADLALEEGHAETARLLQEWERGMREGKGDDSGQQRRLDQRPASKTLLMLGTFLIVVSTAIILRQQRRCVIMQRKDISTKPKTRHYPVKGRAGDAKRRKTNNRDEGAGSSRTARTKGTCNHEDLVPRGAGERAALWHVPVLQEAIAELIMKVTGAKRLGKVCPDARGAIHCDANPKDHEKAEEKAEKPLLQVTINGKPDDDEIAVGCAHDSSLTMDEHAPRPRCVSPIESAGACADECVVCLDGAPTHIFFPCGHQCVCAECAARVAELGSGTCPLCKQEGGVCRVFR